MSNTLLMLCRALSVFLVGLCLTLSIQAGERSVARNFKSGATAKGATRTPEAAGWERWSPRDEIAPEFSIEARAGREGGGALKLSARKAADFGAWRTSLAGLHPGRYYRFTAWYRTSGIEHEQRSVIARLQWLDAQGRPLKPMVRPPEFPLAVARSDGWSRMESVVCAPETAAAMDIQLSLGFTARGIVWWDQIGLTEVDAPPPRTIRAMTVFHRPKNSPSAAANLAQFSSIIREAAAQQKPDIVCLPEGLTLIGTEMSHVGASEPVPGPTTKHLGALARELRTYIVAGLYERVGPVVYNTAVLIDRDGRLVGTYRKTHLPREEWEAGLTPGDTYPVFETDFGRIGLMVCWDMQFPEPWRALGLQGAELFMVPTWGGNETLLTARAIENHAFVVVSGYHLMSRVLGPDGATLAEASATTPAVTVTIDLNAKIQQPFIGHMGTRTWKERRGDLPVK